MTNTQKFAKQELDILAATTPDAIITPFSKEILTLCEAFGNSGQSGGSAPYTASAIAQAVKKLMLHEPICDVTGHESEWCDVTGIGNTNTIIYQNSRCGALFKNGIESKAHYLDAIVWKGLESYYTFTGHVYLDDTFQELVGSSQCIDFPFTAKSFTIDVDYLPIDKEDAEENCIHYIENSDGSCYVSVVKNPKDLEEVWEYYKKKAHK
jgi:hypothetical protein